MFGIGSIRLSSTFMHDCLHAGLVCASMLQLSSMPRLLTVCSLRASVTKYAA